MNERIQTELEKILYTLNLVETHGADNLSRLLGCIQRLQQVQIELKGVKIIDDRNTDKPGYDD